MGAAVPREAEYYWKDLEKAPHPVKGIRDSKKLTPAQRYKAVDNLISWFVREGIGFGYCVVPAAEINRLGHNFAMEKCKTDSVRDIILEERLEPRLVIVDGNQRLRGYGGGQVCIPKADDKYWCVAAASIIAKVIRDDMMIEAAKDYPEYDWDRNKGYAGGSHSTSTHIAALRAHGLTPMHRSQACRTVLSKS